MKSVYLPAEDSYLMQSIIPRYMKNKSVLDMGSGTGILAETALKSKASSVLAADINSESIKLLKSKNIPCIKSNLFSKINKNSVAGLLEPAGGCRFSIIIFNPPYLPFSKYDKENDTSGGKKGDEIIIKFLKQAKAHLNKNGKILLLLSSLTPQKRIKLLLKKLNLNYKTIVEKNLFFEKLSVWEIQHNNP